MHDRVQHLLVGSFVIIAISVAVGITTWIAGMDNTGDSEHYVLLFDRDVNGLTVGSPVRYLGVDVGRVESIRLNVGTVTGVAVQVSVTSVTPINQGTYASLSFQGITGVAFVSLASEAGNHPPLGIGDAFNRPVIPTRDVGIAALLAKSGDITTQVSRTLDSINELLSTENRAALLRTLRRIDSLLVDTQPDLIAAINQFQDATANIARVTGRLDEMASEYEQPLEHFVVDGLGEVPELITEMRGTLRELDKLILSLREDPSQLVHRKQRNPAVADP